MTLGTRSLKNQLKTIGRFPKFLALLGASSLLLPIFSYAASASTVQPSAKLSQEVQVLNGASKGNADYLNVPVTNLASKVGRDGAIRTSTRYSAKLRFNGRHMTPIRTTSTTLATLTTVARATSTTLAASTTTTVALPNTSAPATVTPIPSATEAAPTVAASNTPTTVTPTTTSTVAPTTSTTSTTTSTTVAPPTSTTTLAPTTSTPALAYPIGTPDTTEPSGYAPPGASALSGFSQSYVSDFPGSSLPSGWGVYSGQPGSDPGAQYGGASHISVANGIVSLNTFQDPNYNNEWVTGGMCQCGFSQKYGAYFVRSRVTGNGPTSVQLLWPATNAWPPEIDFNETNGSPSSTSATVHWSTASNQNNQDQRNLQINTTAWHTWGVIWTPTSITYTVDGTVWGQVNNATEIPNIAMTLDLQQQTWCSSGWACPTSPQSEQIDWVAEYSFG